MADIRFLDYENGIAGFEISPKIRYGDEDEIQKECYDLGKLEKISEKEVEEWQRSSWPVRSRGRKKSAAQVTFEVDDKEITLVFLVLRFSWELKIPREHILGPYILDVSLEHKVLTCLARMFWTDPNKFLTIDEIVQYIRTNIWNINEISAPLVLDVLDRLILTGRVICQFTDRKTETFRLTRI